ncbi:MAG TPA: hypothetical protein V6D11_18065 [Waterburya sp.]
MASKLQNWCQVVAAITSLKKALLQGIVAGSTGSAMHPRAKSTHPTWLSTPES